MEASSPDQDWRPAVALAERFRADLSKLVDAPTPDRRLGVAVSGGGDSLALLLLAAAAFPGCVEAATVDHGFRAEATAEAATVAAVCARIGVRHAILTSQRQPTSGSLQMRARAIRYASLERWCGERGLAALATAHHRDDQAETVLLRVARGSGVAGLAAIRPRGRVGGTATLVRPLLAWRRAELAGIVAAAGLVAADDPSNDDARHDRTRARRLLGETAWLASDRLAAVADHARDVEEAVGWAMDRLWAERVRTDERGVAIDAEGIPRELRRRLLERGVALLAGAPVRSDRVAGLLDRLDAGLVGTAGGVKASPGPPWRLTRAPPRRAD